MYVVTHCLDHAFSKLCAALCDLLLSAETCWFVQDADKMWAVDQDLKRVLALWLLSAWHERDSCNLTC